MTFTVRASQRSDLAAVDALLAQSYPKLLKNDYPPSVLVTALPIISRARPELVGLPTYFVAEDPAGIIGAGGWTPDRKTKTLGHIRHLVTAPEQVRRGIARSIIARSLKTARQAGFTQMECWSTLTAVPFYEAMGFEALGPFTITLERGIKFPSVRLMRPL